MRARDSGRARQRIRTTTLPGEPPGDVQGLEPEGTIETEVHGPGGDGTTPRARSVLQVRLCARAFVQNCASRGAWGLRRASELRRCLRRVQGSLPNLCTWNGPALTTRDLARQRSYPDELLPRNVLQSNQTQRDYPTERGCRLRRVSLLRRCRGRVVRGEGLNRGVGGEVEAEVYLRDWWWWWSVV